MIMNKTEFFLMNNPVRPLIQERYEIPILRGMLMINKDFHNALEIGCGNGDGTRLIKRHFKPARIEAIDLDERMIRIAQRRNDDHSVNFRVMDAAELAYPDDSFDVIFDFGIIHHIPNWRDCMFELARVSRDRGYLLLEELAIESFSGFPGILWKKALAHPYEQMFSFNALENCLAEAGFTIINKKYSNPLGMLRLISLTARISKLNTRP
jgi:ubiquinone/menaquinone biosynthesis C-methylase UbiE